MSGARLGFPVLPPIALALLLPLLPAQGTAADYERAQGLGRAYRQKTDEFPREVHWLPDSSALWFQRDRADGRRDFTVVDAATGARRDAFDRARCTKALRAAGVAAEDADRLPVSLEALGADGTATLRLRRQQWTFLPDGTLRAIDDAGNGLEPLRRIESSRAGGAETELLFVNRTDATLSLVWIDGDGQRRDYGEVPARGERHMNTFAGHAWLLLRGQRPVAAFRAGDRAARAVVDGDTPAPRARGEGPAPAGRDPGPAFVRDHNVFLRIGDGEVALTTDGTAEDPYGGAMHWSPDRTRLLVFQTAPAERHEVTLVESSPRGQVQPKLHTFQYLKPGDRIAVPKPRLFHLEERRRIEVELAPFAEPWSIDRVHWAPDSREVYLLYNRRGHQQLAVRAIDATTGAVRTVVEERSATFVDYSQKTFLRWLDGTGELLWTSERDGWNHLYLVDVKQGTARQVTRGPWVVRRVEHVDEAGQQVWFTAFGIRPEQDPYHAHLCRVGFAGGEPVILTAGDGTHEWTFSPDRRCFVDRWSRVDQPAVCELRRSDDGALLCELGRDDAAALLAAGFRPPQRFVAKGRDGSTDIHGIVIRPSQFDPARRYPVIEAIYAGPHDFHVPKGWGLGLRQRALAELGFVVVQIDGMGTNWRSKAFHDVCWRNLKDAGLPDRIAWLRALAATEPALDLSRVGIYGGSAGGQNALAALLHHGDFYKVAAADCGCHDNRMDKIWWNEAWMGWPVGEWYADSSNVVHAGRLTGKLLLTVGELDRNVDPASTMQVVDALLGAGKDFDLVVAPGAGHGVGETPVLSRRRMDFFVRHLLGVEPPPR